MHSAPRPQAQRLTKQRTPSREQVDSIRDAANAKIAALLTETQKAKFDAWQEKHKQTMERRSREDGDAPPPPPEGVEAAALRAFSF